MTTTETLSYERNVPAVVSKELKSIRKKHGITFIMEKNKVRGIFRVLNLTILSR
jgi:hypothetical protein